MSDISDKSQEFAKTIDLHKSNLGSINYQDGTLPMKIDSTYPRFIQSEVSNGKKIIINVDSIETILEDDEYDGKKEVFITLKSGQKFNITGNIYDFIEMLLP